MFDMNAISGESFTPEQILDMPAGAVHPSVLAQAQCALRVAERFPNKSWIAGEKIVAFCEIPIEVEDQKPDVRSQRKPDQILATGALGNRFLPQIY